MDTVLERAAPPTIEPAPAPPANPAITPSLGVAFAALASAGLAACGGGGDSTGVAAPAPAPTPAPAPPPAAPTASEASRFLAQASMGASRADIARVQAIGYAAWIDEQFALPASTTRWDALVAAGFADPSFKNGEGGFDACAWRKLLASPDTLRQRVTLALSRDHGDVDRQPRRRRLEGVRGGQLPRPARGQRVRQLPHADAAGLDQHRDGHVPHLPRQHEGQSGQRLAARRELRARADAAVHDRPGPAQPRRHADPDWRRDHADLHA